MRKSISKPRTIKLLGKLIIAIVSFETLFLSIRTIEAEAKSDSSILVTQEHRNSSLDVNDLLNKGIQALKEGRAKDAVAIYEVLDSWALSNLGEDDENYIYGKITLAGAYREAGMYKKSEKTIITILKLIKQAKLNNDSILALAINHQSLLKSAIGDLEMAEKLANKALEVWLNEKQNTDPMAIQLSINLANILERRSKRREALNKYLSIATTITTEFGRNHPLLGQIYTAIADLSTKKGDLNLAESMVRKAMEINAMYYNKNHPNNAETFNTLGNIQSERGKLNESIKSYEKAYDIYKYLEKSEALAITLNNIAKAYGQLGLYQEAKKKSEKALIITKESLGIENYIYADILTTHGEILDEMKMKKLAIDATRKALSIKIKVLGEEHISTIIAYNNLGKILLDSEDSLDEAYKYLSQSWELVQKKQIVSKTTKLSILSNIGMYWLKKGNTLNSIKLSKEALALSTPDSAIHTYLLNNLGISLIFLGKDGIHEGAKLIKNSVEKASIYYQTEVQFLPKISREKNFNRYHAIYNSGLSIPKINNSAIEIALFTRFNLHGRLEEIEKRQTLMSRKSPTTKALIDELRDINNLLSSFDLNEDKKAQLIRKQLVLETKLFRLLPEIKPRIIHIDEITKALPRKGLLVDFQRHYPIKSGVKYSRHLGDPRYQATLLRKDGNLFNVDLGNALEIDLIISKLIRSIEEGLSDSEELLQQINDIIVKPLNTYISESDEIFIIPDGQINRIPFAALRFVEAHDSKNKSVKIRLLSSGRELLDLKNTIKSNSNEIFLLADPNFSFSGQIPIDKFNLNARDAVETYEYDSISKARKIGWERIKHTQTEVKSIQSIIGGQLWEKDEATESLVKQLVSPKVVHLATHAYYLPDMSRNPESDASPINNTLLSSGIVLAGANNAYFNPAYDGYLTALDITQLNWGNTDLVVISACESGLGEISYGEGVFGLRRAIAIAGARSSVLSLWKVDDKATAAFMTSFYKRLKAGMGRGDALSATQKEFREHQNEDWREPYVWAAFQLSGDWGPIEGL